MSSQRLCQRAPDLHRFKSGITPALRRGDGHKVSPLTNSLFSISYLMEKGKSVLSSVALQVYGPHSSPMARGSLRHVYFALFWCLILLISFFSLFSFLVLVGSFFLVWFLIYIE